MRIVNWLKDRVLDAFNDWVKWLIGLGTLAVIAIFSGQILTFILGQTPIWFCAILIVLVAATGLAVPIALRALRDKGQQFDYAAFTSCEYEGLRWSWTYDSQGRIMHLTPLCPNDDTPVRLHQIDRDFTPNGIKFRGTRIDCPRCNESRTVAMEQLPGHDFLADRLGPQRDLMADAAAFIQGEILSGRYKKQSLHKYGLGQ